MLNTASKQASMGNSGAAETARALDEVAETIAREMFPAGRRQGRDWCVGSLAGEPGQSLRISLTGKYRGRWREFADGTHGDLLDLISTVYCGGDLRQAIKWARSWLGGEERWTRRISEASARKSHIGKLARWLWNEARPAAGTLTDLYLEARRIHCAIPPSIRHHPAMLAAVTDLRTGEFRGLHRTYLQPDIDANPAGKLALNDDAGNSLKSKLSLGAIAGNGIVLGGLSRRHVVFVGEGIETTARAISLTGRGGIAAVSAGNMASLRLPDSARLVYILVDPDTAGERGSREAAQRWCREGRKVHLVEPAEVAG